MLFIGLMSGTSMDAVDAALVDFGASRPRLLASHSEPMPTPLRAELLALSDPRNDDFTRLGQADVAVAQLFVTAVHGVLQASERQASAVTAIGSHGQTLRHRPDLTPPYTLQIGDPNVIAELTGITTVADFRRRDVAAGGQGAPLVPAFHAAMFQGSDADRVVVNIGGMANITVLPADPARAVTGFDTGPGNVLLDGWAQRHLGLPLDRDGAWAATGRIDTALLERLLEDAFFHLPPPKSTGRDHFNLAWLEARLTNERPEDVQATLVQLTVASIARAIDASAPETREVLICGGGAYNPVLMTGLSQRLSKTRVTSTAERGVDPRWVEAMAFAWLAKETLAHRPGNLPAVTGARRAVVLGGIYPA